MQDEFEALEKLFREGRIAEPLMDSSQLIGHPSFPEPFTVTQSVTVPALGTIDQIILDYTPEPGYAAILAATGHRYFGTGYVEGAGMIKWNYFVEYRLV